MTEPPNVDFLLAEYERRSTSLLQDEEFGEKRAAFFLTLVGAAGAVFAFGFDKGQQMYPGWRNSLALAGLSGTLLVMGLMTVKRLLERHVATDRHFYALRDIARMFVTREQALAARNAFSEIYKPREERELRILSVGKGGWMETVALVNALLSGLLAGALVFWRSETTGLSLTAFLIGATAVWICQKYYGYRMISRRLRKAREYDALRCARTD